METITSSKRTQRHIDLTTVTFTNTVQNNLASHWKILTHTHTQIPTNAYTLRPLGHLIKPCEANFRGSCLSEQVEIGARLLDRTHTEQRVGGFDLKVPGRPRGKQMAQLVQPQTLL